MKKKTLIKKVSLLKRLSMIEDYILARKERRKKIGNLTRILGASLTIYIPLMTLLILNHRMFEGYVLGMCTVTIAVFLLLGMEKVKEK